jgi:IS5 family transposase
VRHLSTAGEGAEAMSQELLLARLDALVDLSQPLARLTRALPWAEIDPAVSGTLPPALLSAGRPDLPIRLIAGLLYLKKHTFSLSEEAMCERWLANCYWHYFTGEVYFQTQLPCDLSSFTRWRKRLSEAGLEGPLEQTIEAAKTMRAVPTNELRRLILGITVREKVTAHPTDSRISEIARQKLVKLAQQEGIVTTH